MHSRINVTLFLSSSLVTISCLYTYLSCEKPALKFVTPYFTRIQKTVSGNTFFSLNHHKYFDSYMNRDKPNRNQFKLK